jgi:hypothetical protein
MRTEHFNESNKGPVIVCYPYYQRVERQIRNLCNSFAENDAFKWLRSIEYVGETCSLRVRTQKWHMDSAMIRQMHQCWREFPTIFEADIWDEYIQEKIPEPRIQNWVADVVWWDRSLKCKGKHLAKWREFEAKYGKPYRPTMREFMSVCGKYLTPSEKNAFYKMGRIEYQLIKDPSLRSTLMHKFDNSQCAIRDAALAEIGFVKTHNGY